MRGSQILTSIIDLTMYFKYVSLTSLFPDISPIFCQLLVKVIFPDVSDSNSMI